MLKGFLRKVLRGNSDDSYKDHLYALILAGGGGTRLWPKSRNATPKQFLPLFHKQTLTQITTERLNKILPWERIYIVTVSDDYKKEILKEIKGFIPENIIVEPARRDTAPAHGIGATFIHKKDPEAVIVTESADRLVKPVEKYLDTLLAAAKVAFEEEVMVAMGVEAKFPNVGYGHIKRGKKVKGVNGVDFYVLDEFVEKPPLALAKKYTENGNYYWNAGQFVWRADVLLASMAKHVPEISKKLTEIEDGGNLKNIYETMPKISIDYAIAEKEKNFLVVEGNFDWTDIGDWNEVWKNLPKDKNGNVIIDGPEEGGRVMNIDTTNTLVHTDGKLIAMVDVDDIAIVDTKDILLVCKRSSAQLVKKIVEQLKSENKKELL